jgi:hypothetical protein
MDDNSLDRGYQDNSVYHGEEAAGLPNNFFICKHDHQGKYLWQMPKATLVIDME